MNKKEYAEKIKEYTEKIKFLEEERRLLIDAYEAEHIPFEASMKNPVLCEVEYEYENNELDVNFPSGKVKGVVHVVGWEGAAWYGEQWEGYIIPRMVRINGEGSLYHKEPVHFRLGANFDTLKVTPVVELKDESSTESGKQTEDKESLEHTESEPDLNLKNDPNLF